MPPPRSRAPAAVLLFVAAFLCAAGAARAQVDSTRPPGDSAARSADSTRQPLSPAAAAPVTAPYIAPADTFPYSPAIKSDFLFPLVSILLPGFGQYPQGHVAAGLAFTGVALTGIAVAINASRDLPLDSSDAADLTPKDWSSRKLLLGAQAYQGAGFLSAYCAFRTAVPAFQRAGEYRFLGRDRESLGELFIAPARLSFLGRPTTFIPLGMLAAVIGTLVYLERDGHPGADWTFSADDIPFSMALSYNAGLTEEAVFRGYLLPVSYQHMQSFFFANLFQAALFGAAHYQSGAPIPWPQALLGYYFGYLGHKNNWTISEGIFNHFWWDAIVFTGGFLTMRRVEVNASVTIPITAW